RLVQAGILPQKDSDQAASELAQAQVAAVTARRAQQLATLRAPLAGVVTRMSAVLGASVDATQPLVQIADPAAFDVVFNVSPAEAAEIRDGDSVSLSARESGRGDPLGAAVVTGVAAAVDSLSRAVAVRVRLRRRDRPLRIGESVFGRLVTAVEPHAVPVSVAGLWAAFRLPSAIYPELLFPRIKIVAEGSTLGARQVVFSLTRPLEEAVSVVPGVTRVQSHSIRGASEVAITFGPRTDMAYA